MPTKYVADGCSGGDYHKVKTLLKRSSVVIKSEVKVMQRMSNGPHHRCKKYRAQYVLNTSALSISHVNRQGLEHFWKDRLEPATRNRCISRLETHEK